MFHYSNMFPPFHFRPPLHLPALRPSCLRPSRPFTQPPLSSYRPADQRHPVIPSRSPASSPAPSADPSTHTTGRQAGTSPPPPAPCTVPHSPSAPSPPIPAWQFFLRRLTAQVVVASPWRWCFLIEFKAEISDVLLAEVMGGRQEGAGSLQSRH